MDLAAISQYITDKFEGLDIVVASGDSYIFYDPEQKLPKDRRFPFVTITTSDAYDSASNLSRPNVYRLNIGVSKETYRNLFGPPPTKLGGPEGVDTGHDYTAIDKIMPHPVYAAMSWICIVNPSETTFEKIRPLLADAYETAVKAYDNRSIV